MTANLRIGLNDVQIEEQAVDELIEELQMTDKLLFWIMDYIKENIADDKNWNVISQIKALDGIYSRIFIRIMLMR